MEIYSKRPPLTNRQKRRTQSVQVSFDPEHFEAQAKKEIPHASTSRTVASSMEMPQTSSTSKLLNKYLEKSWNDKKEQALTE